MFIIKSFFSLLGIGKNNRAKYPCETFKGDAGKSCTECGFHQSNHSPAMRAQLIALSEKGEKK